MAPPAKISSIKDIQERQLEIKQQLSISKEAAIQSLHTSSTEVKTVVLRDVILPAAGIALAAYLTVKIADRFLSDPDQEAEEATSFAQAPLQSPPTRPTPQRQSSAPQAVQPKKPAFQSLISLGSLLIPAGQAIMDVIKEERAK